MTDEIPPRPLWPFHLFNGYKNPPRTTCWACHAPIQPKQKFCSECNHWQTWRKHFNFSSTVLSLLVALIAVSSPAVNALWSRYGPLELNFATNQWMNVSPTVLDHNFEVEFINASSRPFEIIGTSHCRYTIPFGETNGTSNKLKVLTRFKFYKSDSIKIERYTQLNNVYDYYIQIRSSDGKYLAIFDPGNPQGSTQEFEQLFKLFRSAGHPLSGQAYRGDCQLRAFQGERSVELSFDLDVRYFLLKYAKDTKRLTPLMVNEIRSALYL